MEKNNDCIFPKIIFLDHDYTPANFSFSHLKLHDIPRTQVLCEAAEKAGFFAKTGLLTHYKSGDWESEGGYYDRRYGYDDDDDEDDIKNGSMGEIFEEYEHIEHWIAGTFPDLGDFVIENENIIGENIIGEGEPHHYEYEGYTGNAGMTMEYWYYYGCIVLWPKAKTLDILKTLNISVNLKWLKYYTELNNNNDTSSKNIIRQILLNIAGSDKFYKVADTNPVAQALIYLNDEEFIKNSCSNLLIECFSMIDENNWEQLLNKYNPEIFEQIFGDTKIINDYFSIYRLFSILDKIPADNKHLASFIQNQTDKIPQYIGNINFKQNKDSDYNYNTHIHNKQSRKEIIMNIFYKLISFGTVRKNDDKWITEIVDTLTQNQERKYVNEVLITVLKNSKEKGKLYDLLYEKCLKNLSDRVNNKPQPLPDWKREVPKSGNFTEQWKIIKDFLESPVQKTFEYKRLQEIRRQMEYAILNSEIDLEFTTIKKGSPHTMLITKNNANYQRELKDWKEDADLLKSLNSES